MTHQHFSNITLTSSQLSVVFYLPLGVYPDQTFDNAYYYSSRFDHGSMVGLIRSASHRLYGTDLWKVPHNSHWPESGAGLASEFGVGDDGDLCLFRCGWTAATEVTNGVLGYQEVVAGQPFLKIGVGQLVKGSCPTCDSTDDYRYNSPYEFAKQPVWKLTQLETNSLNHITALSLEHEEMLRTHGYKLKKEVAVQDNVVSVTNHLTNLGQDSFSTVWYAHNFFTCDSVAVGPGYTTDIDVQPQTGQPLYDEPSTWFWSQPLADYGNVDATPSNHIHVDMRRTLDPGTRIKSEFRPDGQSRGRFQIHACDTTIAATLDFPDKQMSMYAFNLYVERGTFSPIPQLLIANLQPGQTVSWTMKLEVDEGIAEPHNIAGDLSNWMVEPLSREYLNPRTSAFLATILLGTCCFLLWKSWRRHRERTAYEVIVSHSSLGSRREPQ